MNAGQPGIDIVTDLVEYLDLDPFIYLVIVILGIGVWIYGTAVADFALIGRAVWIRRGALVVASLAVLFFAYAVQRVM